MPHLGTYSARRHFETQRTNVSIQRHREREAKVHVQAQKPQARKAGNDTKASNNANIAYKIQIHHPT